jgi:sugar lactone lactonase YvrE
MTDIQCVVDAKALLGEGVCWDAEAQCLWWLDIFAQAIHRYEPKTGQSTTISTPMRPGCLAVRRQGSLVVAMGDGFYFLDPARGRFESIVNVEADIPETRMNDGKTDRQGRFWSGTVFEADGQTPRPIGSLYCLNENLTTKKAATGFVCSNGLAWSPDSRKLYFTDSATPYVWQWDFDASTGEMDRREVFIDLSAEQAVGDGATVDAEGCYWLTLPFKGKVHQYDPSGKLMRAISLPTDTPTCCEFGGPELDILYVSTATLRRVPDQLRDQPWAGALLAIDTGSKGLPGSAFAA